MIKLFTLENLSAFSSDAVYKICLATEEYGLTDENTQVFSDYDELLGAALLATEDGDYVIVAVDNDKYNLIKRELIGKLLLEEYNSEDISKIIAANAGDDLAEIDTTGHSLVARGSTYHLTTDGLFCGFTVDALNGKVTCLPLDFMRIDTLLESLTDDVLEIMSAMEKGERPRVRMPKADIEPYVEAMVQSLKKADIRLALATSDATMWVYNLYDKIEGLTDRISFVEVSDSDEDLEEATAESESVKVINCAKEALANTDCQIGGAISEVYSTEDDYGNTVYFAYAAIVDKKSAKAKKINTSNADDLAAILPHALNVLTSMVETSCERAIKALEDAMRRFERKEDRAVAPAQPAPGEKVLSKNMLILACAAIAIAIILPICISIAVLNPKETTTNPLMAGSPDQMANNTLVTGSSYVGISSTTANPYNVSSGPTVSNNATVTETSAADISVSNTSATSNSTSGTFTFYVFGYGHGVGMSQVGANYLASQGWSWAEILAHYYYDANTVIVYGEVYPQKITYEGKEYETREYLARALQAEMSSTANAEALKAQVVAIYTFARYYNAESLGQAVFKGALTKDSHAFLEDGKTVDTAIYSAVDEIMSIGPYISSGGQTALTPFHAMSAGKTTSYYNTWGKASGNSVPYLSGGRTSLGDYNDSNFKSTFTITSDDFKAYAEKFGIKLSGDPAAWLNIVAHDAAVREDIGYVSSIRVGTKVITGNEFRIKLLNGKLRSHCFAFTYTPDAS